MGLFSRKKDDEGSMSQEPVEIEVLTVKESSRTEITAECLMKTGTIRKGDKLTYRPRFGRDTAATVEGINSMMMELEKAMEGTVSTMTLSGDFSMLTPSKDDILIR